MQKLLTLFKAAHFFFFFWQKSSDFSYDIFEKFRSLTNDVLTFVHMGPVDSILSICVFLYPQYLLNQ